MASLQKLLRPAARRAAFARPQQQLLRPLSTTPALRASVSNAPPRDPPAQADIGVGELEGAKFKIEPMRRVGEDDKTMRARLVYQSRKRGTLESDLLLSTFADAYLPQMTKEQMQQYDMFLDENDWDIYYWATQEVPSPANEAAAATSSSSSSSNNNNKSTDAAPAPQSSTWEPMTGKTGKNAAAASDAVSEELYGGSGRTISQNGANANANANVPPQPKNGEWAATVGTFKPAYRPVPARWRDSEVLRLLREHVKRRSKGGAEGGRHGLHAQPEAAALKQNREETKRMCKVASNGGSRPHPTTPLGAVRK
ncbi:TPR repeat protein-like protein [Apiospora marii]|uniref:Succinate dehydrogenase assembly factor 2, mitochondrial n=1 Tax=Apiospora marii TaxID=335849 RepID=A0ABR1S4L8_9PEZI